MLWCRDDGGTTVARYGTGVKRQNDDDSRREKEMTRIKSKTKYRGPPKMLAAMSVAAKAKIKKTTKYLYCMHHRLDGTCVKKRRLNPE